MEKKCRVKHRTVPTTNQKCNINSSMEDKEIKLTQQGGQMYMCFFLFAYSIRFGFKYKLFPLGPR